MSRKHVTALVLATALALAPLAAAQSDNLPADRTNSAPLGTISMPRAATTDADGAATITANVTLNTSVAEENGAHWILIGVGNDNETDLAVELVSLTTADGEPVEVERTEGQGMHRAQWWLRVDSLPDTVDLRVEAVATISEELVDVETLAMAMTEEYTSVNGPDGLMLLVQSFTNVEMSENADSGDGSDADPGSHVDDSANTTDDNTPDDATDDTEREQDARANTPGLGALAVLAAAGAVAAVTGLRRRT